MSVSARLSLQIENMNLVKERGGSFKQKAESGEMKGLRKCK